MRILTGRYHPPRVRAGRTRRNSDPVPGRGSCRAAISPHRTDCCRSVRRTAGVPQSGGSLVGGLAPSPVIRPQVADGTIAKGRPPGGQPRGAYWPGVWSLWAGTDREGAASSTLPGLYAEGAVLICESRVVAARVHVHGSGVWGNRYWCDWVTGARRVAV